PLADGSFSFQSWPEDWEPFLVEAFYVDPVTLNEYMGTTTFLLTNHDGATNVGNILLLQTFPATAGHVASADLDSDAIEDAVLTYPDAMFVWLAEGPSAVLATATPGEAAFGPVSIADLDGDGHKDLSVIRVGTTVPEVW